jgi:hypothetical protein
LQPELAWYSSMASAYATNPYVWLGTDNEPPMAGAALARWQQQTYDAIRNAGNNNPILIEEPGGGWPGQMGSGAMPTAPYASMTNIIDDLHYYPNSTVAGNSLSAMAAQAQTIQSSDGTVPVLIGEVGQYDGINTGTAAVQDAINSGLGVAFWSWNDGDANALGTAGNLTPYGQQVAGYIAGSGAQGCAQSPVVASTAETAPALAPTSTAQTAPALTTASTDQTAPELTPNSLSVAQVAAKAAAGD